MSLIAQDCIPTAFAMTSAVLPPLTALDPLWQDRGFERQGLPHPKWPRDVTMVETVTVRKTLEHKTPHRSIKEIPSVSCTQDQQELDERPRRFEFSKTRYDTDQSADGGKIRFPILS